MSSTALFHAIELFLKEQLHRTNPLLIYRNIDSAIKEDSQTVGIKEALGRLENLGLGLPKQQQEIIDRIQNRRNRIEHHRYDHKEEDEDIIVKSLQFILFFVDRVLGGKLEADIPANVLQKIQRLVYEHNQLDWLAWGRLESWITDTWPTWKVKESETPDDFEGTHDCPICRECFLVIGYHPKPFCFYCNTSVDATVCAQCGRTYTVGDLCCIESAE